MDLDPAAVEAAAKAIHADSLDCLPSECECHYFARAALTAAAPLIARATADAIADQLDRAGESQAAYLVRNFTHIPHGRTPETDTTEATE